MKTLRIPPLAATLAIFMLCSMSSSAQTLPKAIKIMPAKPVVTPAGCNLPPAAWDLCIDTAKWFRLIV